MATIKFRIKGNKNPSTIYIRFTHGREIDLIKSTSLLVNPLDWNQKTGKLNSNQKNLGFQNILNTLKSHIANDFNKCYAAGMKISSVWLNESMINFRESNIRQIKKIELETKSILDLETKLNFTLKEYTPFKPAVYFLINNDVVVYVGKTMSLPNRISQHLVESIKRFDKIFYIDLLETQLDEIEQQMIEYYNPKYNIHYSK